MRRAIAVMLLLGLVVPAWGQKLVWVDADGGPLTRDQVVSRLEGGGSVTRLEKAGFPLAVLVVTANDPAPPVDALKVAVETAWSAETDAAKVAHVKALADLYTAASQQVLTTDKSTGQTLSALRDAANGLITKDGLPVIRKALAGELVKVLPTADQPWTDATRKTASAAFSKVAAVLGGLK